MRAGNRPGREGGFALMITLWSLVFLIVVAMSFSFSTRRGSASTRNFKEETEAYYHAVSAYEESLKYLLSDKDLSVDFIDEGGLFWTDTERQTAAGQRTSEGAEIRVNITDEESRLNINMLNEYALGRLFKYVGVPEEEIAGLVDSLYDWRDADGLHRLSGAEDEYYGSLETSYAAKNALLDAPEELLLIKGFKPEYLYGGEGSSALYPMITTFGKGLNINTVSYAVLEMLGLDALEIEEALKMRDSENGGLRVIPQRFTAAGVGLTQSYCFRVEVTARMASSGGQTMKITSIVERRIGPDGIKLRTLYWREGFETGGA